MKPEAHDGLLVVILPVLCFGNHYCYYYFFFFTNYDFLESNTSASDMQNHNDFVISCTVFEINVLDPNF